MNRHRLPAAIAGCLALAALTSSAAQGGGSFTTPCAPATAPCDDAAPKPDAPATPVTPAKPEIKWHTVKPEPFNVELAADGVFESSKMHEIKLDPKQWKTLEVVEGAEHGAHVSKGDLLIRFETEDLDRQIVETEKAREAARLALHDAEADLAAAQITVPLDLADAEREFKRSQERRSLWEKVNRDLYVKKIEDAFEGVRFQLDYTAEELKQLKKMYAEDSLTEDTEEIILKRQQRAVDLAQRAADQGKVDYEWSMKFDLPLKEQEFADGFERAKSSLAKAKATLPSSLESKRLAVAKMKRDGAEADRKLAELKADRDLMAVKSPVSGVVHYGQCVRGKWLYADAVAANMRPGGSFKPDAVILTVVEPRPLVVRASIAESQLARAVVGAPARIAASAFPDALYAGSIASITTLPLAGVWDAMIDVKLPDDATRVVAGMSAKITVASYRNDKTIAVPAAAVLRDDDGAAYVDVAGENDKPVKRPVTIGWRNDKAVEITQGLAAGDRVKLPAAP